MTDDQRSLLRCYTSALQPNRVELLTLIGQDLLSTPDLSRKDIEDLYSLLFHMTDEQVAALDLSNSPLGPSRLSLAERIADTVQAGTETSLPAGTKAEPLRGYVKENNASIIYSDKHTYDC